MTILRVAFTSSLALALAATSVAAQDQTLIDSGASRGGFGGPIMRLTRIADKDAFMMGGRGAFIIAGTYAIGGGSATLDADGSGSERNDAFFIIEPGVNAELNVSKGFRFGVGIAYRLINGTNLTAFTDDDLSGANIVITFKFGRFR